MIANFKCNLSFCYRGLISSCKQLLSNSLKLDTTRTEIS